MKRIALVTGGAGFIGTNLVERLISDGWDVLIFDNLSRRGSEKNLKWLTERYRSQNLRFTRGDVREFASVRKIIKGCDVVFHLAAQVAVTTSFLNPREDFEVNALGTFNILEAARKLKRRPIIIYASTNKVYGELKQVSVRETSTRYQFVKLTRGIDEDMPLDFHSPYACSNGAADQYTHDYFRMYEVPTVVFRQSCVYGPHQMGVEDQGWVAYFAICAMADKPVTIYGTGKQVRDILFVDDLVDAYLAAVERIKTSAGKIYNIGGGVDNSLSLVEYVEFLEKILNKKIKIKYEAWRHGDQKIFIADNSRVSRELKWSIKTIEDKGIELMLEWLRGNRTLFN